MRARDGAASRDRRRTRPARPQLVTESLLISVAGGVLGLAVGYAGMTLFRQIEIPTDLPIPLTFQMDRRALVFSLAVAVASAVHLRPRAGDSGDAHGPDPP